MIFDLDPSFLKMHVKLHPRIPTALHFIMYTTEQALGILPYRVLFK